MTLKNKINPPVVDFEKVRDEHRIGVVRIQRVLIDKNPNEVMAALSQMLVVRAECLYQGYVEYLAFHPDFECCHIGGEPKKYEIIFQREIVGDDYGLASWEIRKYGN